MVRLLDYRIRGYAGTRAPAGKRTGAEKPRTGAADAEANGLAESRGVARPIAKRRAGPFLAGSILRFQCLERVKAGGKLRYIHRNPVKRGLVERPEDWAWSSFRHYLTGEEGKVEIESHWTAKKREKLGIFPAVKLPDSA